MLLLDLTPDLAASGHTSQQDNRNIRIEIKFAKALHDEIICLLDLEYDNSIRTDFSRTVTTDF